MKNLSVFKKSIFILNFLLSLVVNPLQAAWVQPPVQVSLDSETVSSIDGPDLSVNAAGNAISAWTNSPNGAASTTIDASYYSRASNTWTVPVIISSLAQNLYGNLAFTQQGDPDVAINASNYSVVVWEGFEFRTINGIDHDNGVVISATRDSNGNWSSVQTISAYSDDTIAKDASVDVNNSGLAIAAWTENNQNTFTGVTNVSFLTQGGTWSTPVTISAVENARVEGGPSVAIDANGNAIVAWRSDLALNQFIVTAATFNASTNSWTPPTALSATAAIPFVPKVAIDSHGNGMVSWTTDTAVQTAYYNFSTGWEPTVTLPAESNDRVYVVLDPAGNATVAWQSNTSQILAARRLIGQDWQTPVVISTGTNNFVNDGNMQNPLSVDSDGNVMFIYGSSTDNSIKTSFFLAANNTWQSPEIVFTNLINDSNDVLYNVGLASCGFAVALWNNANFDTDISSVFATINGNLLLPQNLIKRVCCQKFATQKACLNILTWTPNPCFVAYRIFRDGQFIGEVTKAPFRFADCLNNRTRNATYTITGINIFGFESAPITAIQ